MVRPCTKSGTEAPPQRGAATTDMLSPVACGRIASLSLIVALVLLGLPSALLLTTVLLFALGRPISQLNLPLAAMLALAFAWLAARKYAPQRPVLTFLPVSGFVLTIFCGGLLLCGRFYDVSSDGQTYQQEAIIQLAKGWNPLRRAPLASVHNIWINHYPKAPWIYAAALYALTDNIEQGKVFNGLLIGLAFFCCLAALLTLQPDKLGRAVLLSLLLALNPVAVSQALSFYVDGQLAALLLATMALAYLAYVRRDRFLAASLLLPLILLVNTKFTAIAYLGVMTAGVLLWLLLSGRRKLAHAMLAISVTGILLGLVLVGFNPYVTNTLRKGHPFYPLAGRGAVDIHDPTAERAMGLPPGFREQNRFENLFISLFSRSENPGDRRPRYKVPFSIAEEEVIWFQDKPDLRIGGFGPLFSGVLVLTLALTLALILGLRKGKNVTVLSVLGIAALLLASALVNPECWWARYAPQIWLIPLLLTLPALYVAGNKFLRALGWAVVLVVVINVGLIAQSYLAGQYRISGILKQQLAEIAQSRRPIQVLFNGFDSNRLRFEKRGIPYTEITAVPPGAKGYSYIGTRAVFFYQAKD